MVTDLSAEQFHAIKRRRRTMALRLPACKQICDLSHLPAGDFDLVWQPYSINFVPDVREVFAQVAQRLRAGGSYYVVCANPLTVGLGAQDWDGHGYPLREPYVSGAKFLYRTMPNGCMTRAGDPTAARVSPHVGRYAQWAGRAEFCAHSLLRQA